MAQRRIEHEFDCTTEKYWEIFFLPEFNHALFVERLHFERWEITATNPTPHGFRRTVEAVPPMRNLPGPIQSILKRGAGYREEGEFDRAASRYELRAISSSLPEKLSVTGKIVVTPLPGGRCKRVYDAEVRAKIFGIGGLLEEKVLGDLGRSLERASEHTRMWLERGA